MTGGVVLLAVSPAPSGMATPSPNWRPKYALPRDATSPTTVLLIDFPPASATDLDAAFRMYGVADDSSFTSLSVDFRLTEVAGLRPGSILIAGTGDSGDVMQKASPSRSSRG